jgi:hypothetical protein
MVANFSHEALDRYYILYYKFQMIASTTYVANTLIACSFVLKIEFNKLTLTQHLF